MCGGHQDPLCPDPGPRDGLCGFEFRIWRKRRCGTEQRHQLEGRWDSALGPSPEFCRGVKKQLSPPPAMVGDGVMGGVLQMEEDMEEAGDGARAREME